MKPQFPNLCLLALASGALLGISNVHANPYYWDNDAGAGFGTAGGTWGSGTGLWNLSATGIGAGGNATTSTGTSQNFGTATDGLASGTITVGTVNTGNMTFGAASGAITLSGGTITFGASQIIVDNATNTINSVLAGGNNLTKNGTGTIVFGGANTRTGTLQINNGKVAMNHVLAMQYSAYVTTNSTGAIGLDVTNGLDSGTLTLGGLSGAVNLATAITGYSGVSNLTLNPQGTQSNSYSGNIVDGLGSMALTKIGTGFQTLSGTNSYSGATTISSGILQFTNQVSLYGSVEASWTASNIKVANGATLALNVGGTGQFTAGNVTTLLTNLGGANGTSTTGFATGSNIGFDTTNASGNTFTVSNNIVDNTGSGGGAMGVTKLGINTLVLSGSNTYTGSTNLLGGTLTLNSGSNTQTIGNIWTPQNGDTSLNFSGTSTLNTAGNISQTALNGGAASSGGNRVSITKLDSGTWTLGTITGATSRIILQPQAGTLSVSQIVSGVDLRMSSAGTLRLRTAGNHGVNLINSGGGLTGTIDNSSGGLITFNLNPTIVFSGAFTLSGSSLNMGTGTVALGATRQVTVSDSTSSLTFGGVISGTGFGLTKAGAGTLILGGANLYTGATTVDNGKLLINGSISSSSAVTVNAGTLGGTGTVGGSVSVSGGATLSPGASIESLATGALTMASGSNFAYEVASNSTTGSDLLAVNGALALTAVNLNFDLSSLAALSGGGWTNGNKLTLMSYFDAGSGITSGFNGYADDTAYVFGTNLWLFNYNDSTAGGNYGTDAIAAGQNKFVTMTYSVIPEPRTALLGALGLLIFLRRKR